MLETVIVQGEGNTLRVYNVHLPVKSKANRIAQIHSIRNHIHVAPYQGGAWVDVAMKKLVLKTRIVDAAIGSDHQPNWITLDDVTSH